MGQYLVCPPFAFAQVRHLFLLLHTRRLVCPVGFCATLSVAPGSAESSSVAWVLVWLPDVPSGSTGVQWDSDLVNIPGREWAQRSLSRIVHADTRRVRTCIVLLTWRHVGMSVFRYVTNITLWAALNMFFIFCVYIGSLTIARSVTPQFSTNENWPHDVILQITPSQITGAWNVHNHWSNRYGVIILSLLNSWEALL